MGIRSNDRPRYQCPGDLRVGFIYYFRYRSNSDK